MYDFACDTAIHMYLSQMATLQVTNIVIFVNGHLCDQQYDLPILVHARLKYS